MGKKCPRVETHVYVEGRYQRTNLGHTVGTNPLTPHTRRWKGVDQTREKDPTVEESPPGLYDSSITDRSRSCGGGGHMLHVTCVEKPSKSESRREPRSDVI